MYQFVLVLAKSFREPVWPNGKASGWYTERPRFDSVSAFLSIKRRRRKEKEKKKKEKKKKKKKEKEREKKKKRFADSLEILPLTVNKTLNWLSSLPTLMQIIVMVTVYIVLGTVCLFPHLLGSRSPPAPRWRQFGVNLFNQPTNKPFSERPTGIVLSPSGETHTKITKRANQKQIRILYIILTI